MLDQKNNFNIYFIHSDPALANIGAANQMTLRLDSLNRKTKRTPGAPSSSFTGSNKTPSISAIIAKAPFRLPLRTREEAIHADALLADDGNMKKTINVIADIVGIVKKSDPGKYPSSLVANAIIGRFDLVFLLIKVYSRSQQEESTGPPSASDCFLTDPSKPQDTCLFKLTLNHIRAVVRLFMLTMEECERRGHVDPEPTVRSTKKSGKDVYLLMPKTKK